MTLREVKIFSACPQSRQETAHNYLDRVQSVAEWSERYGCHGILVFADNGIVDPWLVSQHILANTSHLCPLVAVQPIYMHPCAAAKMVASLGHMYGRRISLNMIAGGFRNDLTAMDDKTPHDDRYRRLTEYTTIIQQLLTSDRGVTFAGHYYNVRNLKIAPKLSPELFPEIMLSGSSPAGAQAAAQLNAVAIKYPERLEDEALAPHKLIGRSGVRIGIIARETNEEAWQVAHERFPAHRRGRLLHRMAMKVSDSHWHRQLSIRAQTSAASDEAYWLGPFENYHTFCPHLVGSYERVARELNGYMNIGHDTFILEIPSSEAELLHTQLAFELAKESRRTLPALQNSSIRIAL